MVIRPWRSMRFKRASGLTLLAVASTLLSGGNSAIRGQDGPNPEVDAIFADFDRPGSVGCALGVARDGQFVYKRGYGTANLDWDVPITPTTVFYVGSVSKQFTAATVVLLSFEGKLSLDDDIRRFLPELAEHEPPVTIRHLIHHTGGVPDIYEVMEESGLTTRNVFTKEEALELMSRQPLDFLPGERHEYSNGGYFLLSMIVERASGNTLREYAHERVFQPLGMEDTHFHDRPGHVVKRRAMSYTRSDTEVEGGAGPVVPPRAEGEKPGAGEERYTLSYRGNFALPGAGGLYTTVDDFIEWDRNFYLGLVGGEELREVMLTPGVLSDGEILDYVFAMRIGSYRGLPTHSHTGSYMGFKAYYVRFPEQRFSIWTFCNEDTIEPRDLSHRVADVLLKGELGPLDPNG